jgi:flagellar basal-body rod modification protein FlgD
MQTNAIQSTAASSSTTGTVTAAATKDLGKNEFLKLLLAQLANQDPTKPVDNQAFVAQLATFSQLEQLQALGVKLDTMTIAQASSTQIQVAGLVGKQVEYRTDTLRLDGKPVVAQLNLAANADSLVAVVTDPAGRVVRTLALGARNGGASTFTWDGLDDTGSALPPGDYNVSINANRADGSSVSSNLRAKGSVDAVSFEGDSPVLLVGTVRVKLADVSQVLSAPAVGT